jgi:hypothetical protein
MFPQELASVQRERLSPSLRATALQWQMQTAGEKTQEI